MRHRFLKSSNKLFDDGWVRCSTRRCEGCTARLSPRLRQHLENEMFKYPDDADGNALKRIADDGVDMTKPLTIEFQIAAVPDEAIANSVVNDIKKEGYSSKKDHDEADDEWLIICPIEIVPSYDNIVSTQQRLERLISSSNAQLVGWGVLI